MWTTLRTGLGQGLRTLAKRPDLSTGIKRTIHSSPASLIKMTDFHIRKITQEFDHIYDTDRDGFIDADDINSFKRRLRKYTEQVHKKAMKDAYKAGLDDYWEILMINADVNKDGFVSREEWVHIWRDIINKADKVSLSALPQWVRMMPHSLFPVLDIKGDGVVDQEEYRDFWHYVGGYRYVSDEELDRYFDHMTEGGKTTLDIKRIEELYADFYLSDDPATPGRYIAGPIRFRFQDDN